MAGLPEADMKQAIPVPTRARSICSLHQTSIDNPSVLSARRFREGEASASVGMRRGVSGVAPSIARATLIVSASP